MKKTIVVDVQKNFIDGELETKDETKNIQIYYVDADAFYVIMLIKFK